MKCAYERIWNEKGETLSAISAEKEYGIKRENIIEAIRAVKLIEGVKSLKFYDCILR